LKEKLGAAYKNHIFTEPNEKLFMDIIEKQREAK
jgi:hypothetical protein